LTIGALTLFFGGGIRVVGEGYFLKVLAKMLWVLSEDESYEGKSLGG